jgi:hypothetical protein
MDALAAHYGMAQEFSVPYRQDQNPIERTIQTVRQGALAIMMHCGAPPCMWPYAIMFMVYILNRLPRADMDILDCPYRGWFNSMP